MSISSTTATLPMAALCAAVSGACCPFNDTDRAICVETRYYGSYSPENRPDSYVGGHIPEEA